MSNYEIGAVFEDENGDRFKVLDYSAEEKPDGTTVSVLTTEPTTEPVTVI